MLETTDQERQLIVDYIASQAPEEEVTLLQKVYSERLHGVTHDIWDVHTEKERWWVITQPTNLYLQSQFPNMDLALTFHIGLCLRIPRADRPSLGDLQVEPLLGPWRALQQAQDVLSTSREVEDYQAIGVRCRECLISLVHSAQDAMDTPPAAEELKRSDFMGWAKAIADIALSGSSQKARRSFLKLSAKATWDFVNWLTHSRSAHVTDAEAALSATEQVLNLYTMVCIRHLRGVPDSCPSCGSQQFAPERGGHTGQPEKVFERPVCTACQWTGAPIEIPACTAIPDRPQPEGDCVTMDVALRGKSAPKPTGGE